MGCLKYQTNSVKRRKRTKPPQFLISEERTSTLFYPATASHTIAPGLLLAAHKADETEKKFGAFMLLRCSTFARRIPQRNRMMKTNFGEWGTGEEPLFQGSCDVFGDGLGPVNDRPACLRSPTAKGSTAPWRGWVWVCRKRRCARHSSCRGQDKRHGQMNLTRDIHSQAPVSAKKGKGASLSLSAILPYCPSARVERIRCHFLI